MKTKTTYLFTEVLGRDIADCLGKGKIWHDVWLCACVILAMGSPFPSRVGIQPKRKTAANKRQGFPLLRWTGVWLLAREPLSPISEGCRMPEHCLLGWFSGPRQGVRSCSPNQSRVLTEDRRRTARLIKG